MQVKHNPTIRYVFITERSSAPADLRLPPLCNTSLSIFPYLGTYPKNLDSFVFGENYYILSLLHGLRMGYRFDVCYLDSLLENPSMMIYNDTDTIQLLLISLSDKKNAQALYDILSTNHHDSIYYQCINMDWSEKLSSLPNFINFPQDFLNSLFSKIEQYIPLEMLQKHETFSVPVNTPKFVQGSSFAPTQINTLTIQCSIFGNFGDILFDDNMNPEEDAKEAIKFQNEFRRQQTFVDQINKIDFLTGELKKENSSFHILSTDSIYTPLIISAPFNSPDLNSFFKVKKKRNDEFEEIMKAYNIIINSEQTENYTHAMDVNSIDPNLFQQNLPSAIMFSRRRLNFLDNVGFLHASITSSPYIRLPIIGKSIYNKFFYLSAEMGKQLIGGKNIRKIKKKLQDIANIIPKKTMSDKFLKHLKDRDSQIVAITDMPIEWVNIDGIPLCFSHDVCRIPETPLGGVMAHYMHNNLTPFDIPVDILEKTLVVFGCTDGNFARWQSAVVLLQPKLGYEIVICTSVKQFVKEIKDKKPLFLIIDSHGDTDAEKKESYVMLGDEKLTPADIADNNIHIPLVFLSACSTAPTFGSTNIIANAFFQNFSLSVTSSYLPLDIDTSSVVYLRLLAQLGECSKKCTHKNWLSFISHIFRTSIIMSPYTSAWLDGGLKEDPRQKEEVERMAKSMYFYKRREVYNEMKEGFNANGKHYDIDSILPEYMFYSNLGRSDLIYFDSWKNEQTKKIKNIEATK